MTDRRITNSLGAVVTLVLSSLLLRYAWRSREQ